MGVLDCAAPVGGEDETIMGERRAVNFERLSGQGGQVQRRAVGDDTGIDRDRAVGDERPAAHAAAIGMVNGVETHFAGRGLDCLRRVPRRSSQLVCSGPFWSAKT